MSDQDSKDKGRKSTAAPDTDMKRRGLLRMAAASAGLAAMGGGMLTACGGGEADAADGRAQPLGKPKFDKPTLACPAVADDNTIELTVCAGASGAPAGFSVQWMTCAAYEANGNAWYGSDDPRLCKASFSGNANGTKWNLAPKGCVDVVIGNLNDADPGVSFTCPGPLECDTCYVFRAFAHATSSYNRSDFTANLQCRTAPCVPVSFKDGDFCTRSQGYFSSGNTSRDAMVACFGGDPTGLACTSSAGTTLVTIGGGTYTYAWTTTGICVDVQPGTGVFLMDQGLANLRGAIGGGGTSGYFTANGNNATGMGTGGGLASQTAALTLNLTIAGPGQCADTGCVKGDTGAYADVTLCNFVEGDTFKNDGTGISAATAAALNGQTVGQVLAAANAYLGGAGVVPVPYGLTSAADLNELVANLNLAFDLKDWDNNGTDDCACGGMTAFAESHLCSS